MNLEVACAPPVDCAPLIAEPWAALNQSLESMPEREELRRHELTRAGRLLPVVVPLATLTVTAGAYLTHLHGWAWNLVAIPSLILPAALLSILAEILLVPALTRRFRDVPIVPVMVAARWTVALGSVSLAVLLLGPPMVRADAWGPPFPFWLPRVGAVVGLVVVSVVALYDRIHFRLQASYRELDRRRSLERFLPSQAVSRLLAGDGATLIGERRVVTILFADLRDSTALAERMSGPEVVTFLNTFVGAMATAVFQQGGMIDKFLGDGLMAVFGVIEEEDNGAGAAAAAALGIRAALAEINGERAAAGLVEVRHGVGIHTGEVVLGEVGIAVRSDFTAVGDTVNTASRLEAMTKSHRADTILSAETARRLTEADFSLTSLGSTEVRGRSEPIEIFGLF